MNSISSMPFLEGIGPIEKQNQGELVGSCVCVIVCHTPNSTGVIYVTILPPDFFFSQLESKLHLE